MGFEYYLVVSYEIILYQHCNFYKYGKEAAVDEAIQLYKIFKGTQSPIIPTVVLTVALLMLVYGYNIRRVLGLKHIPVF